MQDARRGANTCKIMRYMAGRLPRFNAFDNNIVRFSQSEAVLLSN